MMKKILLYYPSNKRSVQIETTIHKIKSAGHDVLLLTTCEPGHLHQNLKKEGVRCFSFHSTSKNSFLYYLENIIFLIKFCKQHKIDFIFSNLQHVNFIAVLAQYFIKGKVIVFRHHFKFNKGHFGIKLEVNKNEQLFDKVINLLAKQIIVPSLGVYNGMVKYEKIKLKKLIVIQYLYDFSKYGIPENENVTKIKAEYKARLNLIMVSRLIPFKRHQVIFPVFKKLIDEGFDLQVLILDEGPEKENLIRFIRQNKLTDRIHFLGFKKDFLDYMKASDLLIHPSITEASNSVIKEMGLLEKTVAVCKNVGDFDEYIVDRENGFLMEIEKPDISLEKIIREVYDKPEVLNKMGIKLRSTVLNKFGDNSEQLIPYLNLIK